MGGRNRVSKLTITVKAGSDKHKHIEWGVNRFGNDYRHEHLRKSYRIVDFKPGLPGEFNLILESVV